MQKVRYELDPYNRFLTADGTKSSTFRKFRNVLDGRFSLDDNNDLTYHVKAPAGDGQAVPHQLRLKGIWSLTKIINYLLRWMKRCGRLSATG